MLLLHSKSDCALVGKALGKEGGRERGEGGREEREGERGWMERREEGMDGEKRRGDGWTG